MIHCNSTKNKRSKEMMFVAIKSYPLSPFSFIDLLRLVKALFFIAICSISTPNYHKKKKHFHTLGCKDARDVFFPCKYLYRGTTEALDYCNDLFQCIKFTSESLNYCELSVNTCCKRSWNDVDVRVHLNAVEITALWNRLKTATRARTATSPAGASVPDRQAVV